MLLGRSYSVIPSFLCGTVSHNLCPLHLRTAWGYAHETAWLHHAYCAIHSIHHTIIGYLPGAAVAGWLPSLDCVLPKESSRKVDMLTEWGRVGG
jgi:hypothetical protein